jgi:hypothetical protein
LKLLDEAPFLSFGHPSPVGAWAPTYCEETTKTVPEVGIRDQIGVGAKHSLFGITVIVKQKIDCFALIFIEAWQEYSSLFRKKQVI